MTSEKPLSEKGFKAPFKNSKTLFLEEHVAEAVEELKLCFQAEHTFNKLALHNIDKIFGSFEDTKKGCGEEHYNPNGKLKWTCGKERLCPKCEVEE